MDEITRKINRQISFDDSKLKGKVAEEQVYVYLTGKGYSVRKIHEGADFIATKNGIEYPVEVKAGNSQLSEPQLQLKKRKGKKYIIIRIRNPMGFFHPMKFE